MRSAAVGCWNSLEMAFVAGEDDDVMLEYDFDDAELDALKGARAGEGGGEKSPPADGTGEDESEVERRGGWEESQLALSRSAGDESRVAGQRRTLPFSSQPSAGGEESPSVDTRRRLELVAGRDAAPTSFRVVKCVRDGKLETACIPIADEQGVDDSGEWSPDPYASSAIQPGHTGSTEGESSESEEDALLSEEVGHMQVSRASVGRPPVNRVNEGEINPEQVDVEPLRKQFFEVPRTAMSEVWATSVVGAFNWASVPALQWCTSNNLKADASVLTKKQRAQVNKAISLGWFEEGFASPPVRLLCRWDPVHDRECRWPSTGSQEQRAARLAMPEAQFVACRSMHMPFTRANWFGARALYGRQFAPPRILTQPMHLSSNECGGFSFRQWGQDPPVRRAPVTPGREGAPAAEQLDQAQLGEDASAPERPPSPASKWTGHTPPMSSGGGWGRARLTAQEKAVHTWSPWEHAKTPTRPPGLELRLDERGAPPLATSVAGRGNNGQGSRDRDEHRQRGRSRSPARRSPSPRCVRCGHRKGWCGCTDRPHGSSGPTPPNRGRSVERGWYGAHNREHNDNSTRSYSYRSESEHGGASGHRSGGDHESRERDRRVKTTRNASSERVGHRSPETSVPVGREVVPPRLPPAAPAILQRAFGDVGVDGPTALGGTGVFKRPAERKASEETRRAQSESKGGTAKRARVEAPAEPVGGPAVAKKPQPVAAAAAPAAAAAAAEPPVARSVPVTVIRHPAKMLDVRAVVSDMARGAMQHLLTLSLACNTAIISHTSSASGEAELRWQAITLRRLKQHRKHLQDPKLVVGRMLSVMMRVLADASAGWHGVVQRAMPPKDADAVVALRSVESGEVDRAVSALVVRVSHWHLDALARTRGSPLLEWAKRCREGATRAQTILEQTGNVLSPGIALRDTFCVLSRMLEDIWHLAACTTSWVKAAGPKVGAWHEQEGVAGQLSAPIIRDDQVAARGAYVDLTAVWSLDVAAQWDTELDLHLGDAAPAAGPALLVEEAGPAGGTGPTVELSAADVRQWMPKLWKAWREMGLSQGWTVPVDGTMLAFRDEDMQDLSWERSKGR